MSLSWKQSNVVDKEDWLWEFEQSDPSINPVSDKKNKASIRVVWRHWWMSLVTWPTMTVRQNCEDRQSLRTTQQASFHCSFCHCHAEQKTISVSNEKNIVFVKLYYFNFNFLINSVLKLKWRWVYIFNYLFY